MTEKKRRHNIMLSVSATDIIKARSAGPLSKSAAIEDLIEKGMRWEREQKARESGEQSRPDGNSLAALERIESQIAVILERQKQAATLSEIRSNTQTEAATAIIDTVKRTNNNMVALYDRMEVVIRFVGTIIPRALNLLLLYSCHVHFKSKYLHAGAFTKEQLDEIKKNIDAKYNDRVCPVLDIKEYDKEDEDTTGMKEQKPDNKGAKKP
ncbi:MAG TPA: hypothetical protein PKH10_01325 [bacterium]|nr:hypothetical protein [bacterium]HSA34836.1 hypothetical protein [bacterium]